MPEIRIRKATALDAPAISAILESITSERIHSAIERPWSVPQQTAYIESLSPREAIHVAEHSASGVIAFQILDLWSPQLPAMNHVGQLGTYVLPAWRGHRVAARLWQTTRAYAVEAGFHKLAIQVRASNTRAQAYYRSLGFEPCGRFRHQVIIDGAPDDEILMELFL